MEEYFFKKFQNGHWQHPASLAQRRRFSNRFSHLTAECPIVTLHNSTLFYWVLASSLLS